MNNNYTEELARVRYIMEDRLKQFGLQKEKIASLKEEYNKTKQIADTMKNTINYIVELLKQVRQHEDDRKTAAYQLIDEAIKEVSNVVPSANMENAGLAIENGEAFIVNRATGLPIVDTEGGAAGTITSLIMRYLLVTNNASALQMMYIDEGLFSVGHKNIDKLKEQIKEMAKDTLIIITEQKHDVTEGIADYTYVFNKPSLDSPTEITMEVTNAAN